MDRQDIIEITGDESVNCHVDHTGTVTDCDGICLKFDYDNWNFQVCKHLIIERLKDEGKQFAQSGEG